MAAFANNVIQFPVHGNKPVVLLIDDEPVIQGVFSEFLRQCGYSIKSARSAEEAIGLLEAGLAVDLVFSDIRLPGKLDGYSLARWLREKQHEIPVILVNGDMGKANAAAEYGAHIFPKPYDFDAAVRKIRVALAKRTQQLGG